MLFDAHPRGKPILNKPCKTLSKVVNKLLCWCTDWPAADKDTG